LPEQRLRAGSWARMVAPAGLVLPVAGEPAMGRSVLVPADSTGHEPRRRRAVPPRSPRQV